MQSISVVKKFGGTSVGDISRIKNVARLVKEYHQAHPGVGIVVVVSAMAGETNKLIALAKECVRNPDPRELDMLLATGEMVTSALTAMALQEEGFQARSFDGFLAGISTDSRHTNAKIIDINAEPLRQFLSEGGVPVVTGFQGVTEKGDFATLGRGGSDITGVALAAALQSKACYIYTDVEGVYSSDPRICRKVNRLEYVCHEEMLEMASLGAKVLHPRSVYFAMTYNVPLAVLSTFSPERKTWIVKEEDLVEKPIVTGVTYRLDEARVTVAGLPKGSDALSVLFSSLAEADIFIDVITQTPLPDGTVSVSFTVPEEVSGRALDLSAQLVPQLHAQGASVDRDIAKVSIVGIGMRYHTGVAARAFSALAQEGITIEMISTSEIKLSVVIPRKYCEIAVRTLHECFIEMEPEVSVEV